MPVTNEGSHEALAAVSGAYLYAVGVVINGYRARTLLPSDLLWCGFRLIIAIPLGMSLSLVASESLGPFIAFSLGAFPIETINRLLRRLANKTLNQSSDENETSDQLINLLGVTPEVSAALNGEGISAIQEIANTDPVALAIRTGLPFDYILNLASQSQAWCYLSKIGKLAELGFADARAIAKLAERLQKIQPAPKTTAPAPEETAPAAEETPPDSEETPPESEEEKILAALATAAGVDKAVLKFSFLQIAADPYTRFLLQFSN